VKSVPINTALAVCLLLAACASTPDHFYTLSTLPDTGQMPQSTPTTPVRLNVTVPSLVDRSEIVLNTSKSGILVFDHERWGAPLSDQVTQTLARDIEQRRADLLIGDRRFAQSASPPVSVRVDIIRMSAQRNGAGSIEAHWRVVDASSRVDQLGSGSFTVSINGDSFAAVAQAYSQLLSKLAEKLAADIRRR
jgi:uncharacterized protein